MAAAAYDPERIEMSHNIIYFGRKGKILNFGKHVIAEMSVEWHPPERKDRLCSKQLGALG